MLFGAPFDSTTSFRPGTRFAPHAIRSESFGLETYSPWLDRDLEDISVFDSGDIELCIGSAEKALDQISERTATILKDGKIPFMIGGEHLVTLGAFREVFKKFPNVHIIHFDAHTDLRDDYLDVKLSHACVLRRCHDLVGDGRIHQFGIRSGERAEWQWARAGHTDLHPFSFDGLAETVAGLAGKPVYFTIDLDVMDPSVFPGTGTPEYGGVTFMQLFEALKAVCIGSNIVGLDVNELCPPYDQTGASTAAACKIIRELLLSIK